MRNYPRFLKAFAYLLSFTTSMMPLHGYAANQPNVDAQDFISQLGREGQAFAKEIGSEMSATPAQVQNGTVSIPTRDE
ncbi:MAG: hypothetical protein SWN10_13735, partial [Pseudomonadota bacterium]|nr:hypothetical protein [Pseudomonadota bacterium]